MISVGINQTARAAALQPLIDAERDRRTAVGFLFSGKLIQAREQDKLRINGAATLATLATLNGALADDYLWHGGVTPFEWICADNTTLQLDAFEMIQLGQAAAAHEQAHVFAARALKDADPIPADYTDDSHWPAVPS